MDNETLLSRVACRQAQDRNRKLLSFCRRCWVLLDKWSFHWIVNLVMERIPLFFKTRWGSTISNFDPFWLNLTRLDSWLNFRFNQALSNPSYIVGWFTFRNQLRFLANSFFHSTFSHFIHKLMKPFKKSRPMLTDLCTIIHFKWKRVFEVPI